MLKRIIALTLALCLLMSLSASASLSYGQVITASPELYGGVDLTKPYTVSMYLVGDRYPDTDLVLAEINKILEEQYNTTLTLTFLSWADYETMYSLVLAGGEKVDCIYTAPWCFMFTEAAKGSFYEMDEAFIQTYMPLTWQYQNHESFGEAYVNGAYVAIPCSMMKPQSKYVAIRDDLREKYALAPLDNWADYLEYCLTIAEQETPVSGIYALAANTDNRELWRTYYQQSNSIPVYNDDFLYSYHEDGSLPDGSEIKYVYETEQFRAFCKDMKTLADAGAWSRSAVTNTITQYESFANLQGASICWNGTVFTHMKRAEQNEGVKTAAYDLTKNNIVVPEAYSNSDMAITASCENPERTAMVMDLLSYDYTLNNLACLGIEGKNWIDAGDANRLGGADYDSYPSIGNALGWWAKNSNWHGFYDDPRNEVIDIDQEARMVANPTITFLFDESPVKAYMAAVSAIKNEYFGILTLGLVDDVDAAVDEMVKKMYDSGLQKVYDEYLSQYEAWKATR